MEASSHQAEPCALYLAFALLCTPALHSLRAPPPAASVLLSQPFLPPRSFSAIVSPTVSATGNHTGCCHRMGRGALRRPPPGSEPARARAAAARGALLTSVVYTQQEATGQRPEQIGQSRQFSAWSKSRGRSCKQTDGALDRRPRAPPAQKTCTLCEGGGRKRRPQAAAPARRAGAGARAPLTPWLRRPPRRLPRSHTAPPRAAPAPSGSCCTAAHTRWTRGRRRGGSCGAGSSRQSA